MSVYKEFPNAEVIREWDKLLALTEKEVIDLYKSWHEIQKENQETYKRLVTEKNTKIDEVVTFLKTQGIDVIKYKKSGFFPKPSGYQAWFKNNVVDKISEKYPSYQRHIPTAHMTSCVVQGIELSNNQSPTNVVELHRKITNQFNSKINQFKKTDKLLIKSIAYATEHQIDIEDLTPTEVIATVAESAKEKYLKEQVPFGTEVYLKHECYECSTYIMGEHRCSCGNRRISIVVEGDLIQGFEYYPEAN